MVIRMKLKWPEYDERLLVSDKTNFVIQVNGKKRGLIQVKNNINENDLIKIIKQDIH